MKVSRIALLGAAAALVGAAFVSCAGAPARADMDVVAVAPTGEWMTFNDEGDGGTSFVELTDVEVDGMEAFHLAGELTESFQWGFAGWGIEADAEGLENLRNATALSFMVRGDGQRYSVQMLTTDVTDYGFFAVNFDTVEGQDTRITVPFTHFMQPGWARSVGRLRMDRAINFQWQTHESIRPGAFELTIWDVRLYVPAGE